jgi:hypothetical protein
MRSTGKGPIRGKVFQMQILAPPVLCWETLLCQSLLLNSARSDKMIWKLQGLDNAARNNNSIFPLFISITTFFTKRKKNENMSTSILIIISTTAQCHVHGLSRRGKTRQINCIEWQTINESPGARCITETWAECELPPNTCKNFLWCWQELMMPSWM